MDTILIAKLLATLQMLSSTLAQVSATNTFNADFNQSLPVAPEQVVFFVPQNPLLDPEKPEKQGKELEIPLSQAQIRTKIIENARKWDVNESVALAVSECESSFLPTAKSKTSSAAGLFQTIKSTFSMSIEKMNLPTSSSPFDPDINANVGTWLLSQPNGIKHFEASKSCWSKKIQLAKQ